MADRWIPALALALLAAPAPQAGGHIITAVTHGVPMGVPGESVPKDYRLNMGSLQGLGGGVVLEVFRRLPPSGRPLEGRRPRHRVKVGELEVIHADDRASIARLKSVRLPPEAPLLEIQAPCVGDRVGVKVRPLP